MTTSSSIFDRLKTEINLPDFVQQYLLTGDQQVKPQGSEFVTKCFVNDEDKPSCTIRQKNDNWLFHCFSCGTNGDIVDLVMHAHDCTRKEALDFITPKTHIKQAHTKPDFRNLYTCRLIIQDHLTKILLGNQDALNTLLDRNITTDDIKRFGIGMSNGNLYNYFYKKFESTFTGANGPKTMLIDTGIAHLDKGKVYDVIAENMLTFPVYHSGHISHWILHRLSGGSCRQIHKKKHDEGAIFWNQKATNGDEFWITRPSLP
jgi:DNA primase